MLRPAEPSHSPQQTLQPALSPIQARIRKLDDFIVLAIGAARTECPLSSALREQLDTLALHSQAVRIASLSPHNGQLLLCLEEMDTTVHQVLQLARHSGRGLRDLVALLQVIANAVRRLRKEVSLNVAGAEASAT